MNIEIKIGAINSDVKKPVIIFKIGLKLKNFSTYVAMNFPNENPFLVDPAGIVLTPHFGQISALALILAPHSGRVCHSLNWYPKGQEFS